MTAQQDPPAKPADTIFVHSRSEQGDGFKVVRMREESIEIGEIREAKEGRPIHGDLVALKPRSEHEQLFDVEVLVPGPKRAPDEAQGRSGPAQVATDAYRANWTAIFGSAASAPSDDEPN